MGLLDRFRKESKEDKIAMESKQLSTELEKICKGDHDTYEALLDTMFLDPRKISVSMKDAVGRAKKSEKAKDLVRAKIWYEIAGGLAIYKDDSKKVDEYFSKCKEMSPSEKYLILKRTEKAVAKAQEYYKKHLKD